MASNCPGLPQPTTFTPICPGKWPCPDGSNCKSMTYIIAPHYIKHGDLLPGVTGAYVPAMTVCFADVNPIRLRDIRKKPQYKTVTVPTPINY